MKLIKVFIMVFLFLALQGCKNKTDLDANGIPAKLIVAIYGGDQPGLVKSALEPFRVYLEKKLGVEVEFIFATDYTAVIEGIRSRKVHIAYLSPFSYILASQKGGIIPLVTLGEDGKAAMYHSTIITSTKSGLKSMADVKARAKSLTLCFADPASTSGHLIPMAYLTSIGLNPDSAFKGTMFAGSHAASIMSVKSGKVDIGCTTSEYGINLLIKRGLIKPGELIELWKSAPIVSSAIAIRSDINKDFANKVKQLYLTLAKEQPAIFMAYIKLYHADAGKLSYMPVEDSTYNGLRRIASGIKDLSVLTKGK